MQLIMVQFCYAFCFKYFTLFCERFEPSSHFKSRLSMIVRVNVVLNRNVVVQLLTVTVR